jgi:hypothetical protein
MIKKILTGLVFSTVIMFSGLSYAQDKNLNCPNGSEDYIVSQAFDDGASIKYELTFEQMDRYFTENKIDKPTFKYEKMLVFEMPGAETYLITFMGEGCLQYSQLIAKEWVEKETQKILKGDS